MRSIDLRSDTVTKPTEGMLNAMMNAEVGDDVFGEDPTINELQDRIAKLFGHEAGIFCPSGTMTNQIAIQIHAKPGDEVICHKDSHVYNYEGGGIARNALASTKLVHNNTAVMTASEIDELVNAGKDWLARTSLVVAEDTSNRGGGKCYEIDNLKEISSFCKSKKLAFHLDGARIFNAIVKQGHAYKEYGQLFDSISICLSKGLGTPAGSVLIGPHDFIYEARRVRKVMGGGMRQAGFLAAAGIYAIENNIERLKLDHANAKALARHLTGLTQVTNIIPPETNILIFDVNPEKGADYFIEKLEEAGLRTVNFGKNRIRIVTHLGIGEDEVSRAGEILKTVLN